MENQKISARARERDDVELRREAELGALLETSSHPPKTRSDVSETSCREASPPNPETWQ